MNDVKTSNPFVIVLVGLISYLTFSFFTSVLHALTSIQIVDYIPILISCFFMGYFAEKKYWLYSLIFTIFFIFLSMIPIKEFNAQRLLFHCILIPINIIVSYLGSVLSKKKFIQNIFIVIVGYLIYFLIDLAIDIIPGSDVTYISTLFASLFVGYFVTKKGWIYGGISGLLIEIQTIIGLPIVTYQIANSFWYPPVLTNETFKLLAISCFIGILGGYIGENIKKRNLKKIIIPSTILFVSIMAIIISQKISELQSKNIINKLSEFEKKNIFNEHYRITFETINRVKFQDTSKSNIYIIESLKLIDKKIAKKYNISEKDLHMILGEMAKKNLSVPNKR